MFAEDPTGQSHRHNDYTIVADTSMVPSGTGNAVQPALDPTPSINTTTGPSNKSPTPTSPNGVSCLRQSFDHFHLSTDVTDFIMQSWHKANSTTYINQWVEFCSQRQVPYYSPVMKDTVQFLKTLVNKLKV